MRADGRPTFHVVPEHGWLNDPNGLIWLNGRYHAFFQHNPAAAVWDDIHWGHASSVDLVHWRPEPIALAPGPDGPDADGCWSGSAVAGPEGPVILYTGRRGKSESVCLAHGDPTLRSWHKDAANPVLTPPPDLALSDFRDPRAWHSGSEWRMVVGAGRIDGSGAVLLFRSSDLRRWELLGPVLQGRVSAQAGSSVGAATQGGEVWECPDLFTLDGHDVLIYSVTPDQSATRYASGSLDADGLRVVRSGYLDFGRYFYAAQTFVDAVGRRLLMGWIREGRSVQAQRAAGWSGLLSLPREMSVTGDGRVSVRPIPELAALRTSGSRIDLPGMIAGEVHQVSLGIGPAWEARLRFRPGPGSRLGLELAASADGREATLVEWDAEECILSVDRSRSSLDPDTDRDTQVARPGGSPGEEVELHMFADGSVIEIFLADTSLTSRVYPTLGGSRLSLAAHGGDVGPVSLELWQLSPGHEPD